MKLAYAIAVTLTALICVSCGEQASKTGSKSTTDSTSTTASMALVTCDTLPPDSPQEFERKRQIVLTTVPSQRARAEFALQGVSRIVLFDELGLGEQLELTAPSEYTRDWPSGISINRCFGPEKTILAVRFVLDTLPGSRLPGQARLCLVGAHCYDEYGPNVTFPGVYGGRGMVTLYFEHNMPYVEVACCDKGEHITYGTFGTWGDTLMALYIFDPGRREYAIQLLGPYLARGFSRFGYVDFRTERGVLHPEQTDYPYECHRLDSGSVDLAVGITRRQILDQTEPCLRVKLF